MSYDGAGDGGLPAPVTGMPRRPPASRKSSTNSVARILSLSRPSSPSPAASSATHPPAPATPARGLAWMKDYFGSAADPAPIPGTPSASAPGTRAPSLHGSQSNMCQPLIPGNASVQSTATLGAPAPRDHTSGAPAGAAEISPAASSAGARFPALSSQQLGSAFDEEDEEDEHAAKNRLAVLASRPTSKAGDGSGTFTVPHLLRRRSSATAQPPSDATDSFPAFPPSAHPRRRTSFFRRAVPKLGRVFLPTEPDESIMGQQAMAMKSLRGTGEAEVPPPDQAAPAAGRPVMLPSRTAEVLFVMVCSCGQGLFSHLLGNVVVMTIVLTDRLGMTNSQMPWLNGAFCLSNGLSVTISGSLADIYGARVMIVGSLAWLSVANALGAILMLPNVAGHNAVAFCIVRALQGLAIGGLTSSSVSYLGRVYKPGIRRNRVFSIMAGIAPVGYVTGGLHAAALKDAIPWIFGSMAMATLLLFFAALKAAPTERTMQKFERMTGAPPHIKRKFDYIGAGLAIAGSGLIIFGVTQGSSTNWAPYTYATAIAGVGFLALFAYIETKVSNPLVPPHLWRIPSFSSVASSYFLCYGSFAASQVYAIRFWQDIQGSGPMTSALQMIPNAVIGLIAAMLVGRLFHVLAGHYILGASCLAAMFMPIFFLINRPPTNYFIFSMWGIAISTFSPDLSFAACSLFISNSVSRRYQGVSSSILITMQNLSSALLTSLAETVGSAVENKHYTVLTVPEQYRDIGYLNTTWTGPVNRIVHGDGVTLNKLHAIWLFCLGGAALSLLICIGFLRIPKGEERDHQD